LEGPSNVFLNSWISLIVNRLVWKLCWKCDQIRERTWRYICC